MKYLIAILILIGFIYLTYKTIKDPDLKQSYRECKVLGKVSKSRDRGYDTAFFLVVEHNNIIKEVEIDTTIYVKYDKGDTVYLYLSNDDLGIETDTDWEDLLILYLLLIIFILFIYALRW